MTIVRFVLRSIASGAGWVLATAGISALPVLWAAMCDAPAVPRNQFIPNKRVKIAFADDSIK